jgi:hypothetical protein
VMSMMDAHERCRRLEVTRGKAQFHAATSRAGYSPDGRDPQGLGAEPE